jgi:hypothetical protein
MYHAIVKRIATRNFERVNDHDCEARLKNCTPDVHHRFGGHHALGGERHDKEALRRWFERLGRVGPDSQAHRPGSLGQGLSQVVAESTPVFTAAGVEDALAEPITS